MNPGALEKIKQAAALLEEAFAGLPVKYSNPDTLRVVISLHRDRGHEPDLRELAKETGGVVAEYLETVGGNSQMRSELSVLLTDRVRLYTEARTPVRIEVHR